MFYSMNQNLTLGKPRLNAAKAGVCLKERSKALELSPAEFN